MKKIQIRCKGTKTIEISSLQNFQGNLKDLKDTEYKKLRKSIEKYGFRFPIFVWGDFILDGHQRIFTIRKMVEEGWSIDPIPVVEIEADNEKEAKALVLLISSRYGHMTDEGLYEFIMTAELNFDELKEEIDLPEINLKQFEQSYFTEEPQDAEPQIDRAEELNKKWQVKKGDLWQIGEHRMLCGDSTKAEDVERVMGGEKAILMVTDPPYGVEYDANWRNEVDRANGKPYGASAIGKVENDNQSDWSQTWKNFSGDVIYSWHPPGATSLVHGEALQGSGFEIRMVIIWAKNQFPIGRGHYHVKHEPCFYAIRKGSTAHWIGDHSQTTLWEIDKPVKSETGHSTQKPLECMARPIRNHDSEFICDFFLGSGTTMVACQNLNRKCRAIEISPAYCAVTLERMATAFPEIEIKKL